MSSLLLGDVRSSASGAGALMRSIDHRFSRATLLKYAGFVYPARPDIMPNALKIQAEVAQASHVFISMPASSALSASQDAPGMSYAGEIPLESLPSGKYELRVTTIGAAEKPLVQRTYFEVR
jgi:hypothetical protein